MTDVQAQLKPGSPAEVGMSAERLQIASDLIAREISAAHITAAAIIVARRETVVLHQSFGKLVPGTDSPAVEPDSVFLLASITKPVTAAALMLLVERGEVSLEDRVQKYIPKFVGVDRDRVRVRHLLSHVSGMPDMLPENIELRQAHTPLSGFVAKAATTPLLFKPTTDFHYQSKGVLLAAEIVERISGQRLRDFEEKNIFAPLGMKHSALGLGRFKIEDTVWCGTEGPPGSAAAQRYGANSPYWRDLGNPWGGMHSTTSDLAIFLQTMLDGGQYADRRVFSPATVQSMTTDQNRGMNAPWGFGWALRDSRVWNFFGELCSSATFGHVGATGTVAWADPERDLLCVILTNQMLESGSFLRRVSNAVVASVVE